MPSPGDVNADRLELAHVVFMDLVAFSTLPMEEQREQLRLLQKIVRSIPQFRAAEHARQLICLPTGDGMALVFFGDMVSSVECAISIADTLTSHPSLKLRIGLNT